jgi:hypothetical protein
MYIKPTEREMDKKCTNIVMGYLKNKNRVKLAIK